MVVEILERLLEGLEEELGKALRRLRKHFPRHHRLRRQVEQVLFIIIDNQTFILMANLLLKPGKRYTITPGLIDSITKAPVPGATLVKKLVSLDSNVAAVIDADGKIAFVASGTSQLTVVGSWTYKDANTGEDVSVDKTSVVTVTSLAAAEIVEQTIDLTGEEDIPAPLVAGGDGGTTTA